jgi:hypothetical protein
VTKVSFEWNSATTPEEGAIVYVLASDDIGPYLIPFPVVFRDDSWWNSHTREVLDTFIVGWRRADDLRLWISLRLQLRIPLRERLRLLLMTPKIRLRR